MLTVTLRLSCSFVDRDMFMRHFGLGVGHLQYERQHEVEPDAMMALDNLSDSSDKNDTEDVDDIEIVGHDDFAVESGEVSYSGEIVDDDEGECSGDVADIISDSGGSDTSSVGYASY